MLPGLLRRVLDRISQRTIVTYTQNFLERFVEAQQVTSLLRKTGWVGPHLVETW